MRSLLGVSESAGSLSSAFFTPSAPPSTYTFKLTSGF
jgi:hypothetical protein